MILARKLRKEEANSSKPSVECYTYFPVGHILWRKNNQLSQEKRVVYTTLLVKVIIAITKKNMELLREGAIPWTIHCRIGRFRLFFSFSLSWWQWSFHRLDSTSTSSLFYQPICAIKTFVTRMNTRQEEMNRLKSSWVNFTNISKLLRCFFRYSPFPRT